MYISDKVAKAILEQAGREQAASNIYMALSLCLENMGFTHASKWFDAASKEETEHRDKMLRYLSDMGCPCSFGAGKTQETKASDLADAFQQSLDLELQVSGHIHEIAGIIQAEGDWFSWSFWNYFLDEQLSSVRELTTIVARANHCNGNWLEFDETLEG